MESFKARRENIMNMFSQAKQDLEQLNTEIDVAIAGRKEKNCHLASWDFWFIFFENKQWKFNKIVCEDFQGISSPSGFGSSVG